MGGGSSLERRGEGRDEVIGQTALTSQLLVLVPVTEKPGPFEIGIAEYCRPFEVLGRDQAAGAGPNAQPTCDRAGAGSSGGSSSKAGKIVHGAFLPHDPKSGSSKEY